MLTSINYFPSQDLKKQNFFVKKCGIKRDTGTLSGVGAGDERELPRLAPSQTVGFLVVCWQKEEEKRERIYRLKLWRRGVVCRVGTVVGFGLAMLHLCGFPAFSAHQDLKSGRN